MCLLVLVAGEASQTSDLRWWGKFKYLKLTDIFRVQLKLGLASSYGQLRTVSFPARI